MTKADEQPAQDDPYLEDVIEDAIGPLADLLPPDEKEALRRALRDAATDDPALSALYEAARPRSVPSRSGDEPKVAGAPEESKGAPVRKKGSAA